jgi:hypothetical protein
MHRCGKIRFAFRRGVTQRGTREGTGYVPEDSQHGRNRSVFRLSGCRAPGLGQKYISPSTGCFLARLASGDKAVAAARQSKLPPGTLKVIDEVKRYPEGTAVRIEVHGAEDIRALQCWRKLRERTNRQLELYLAEIHGLKISLV